MSIWLDTLSRELLESGDFAALVERVRGDGSDVQPDDLRQGDHRLGPLRRAAAARSWRPAWRRRGAVLRGRARRRARARRAILRPAYERSGGRDGFVSFECTPDVADDTEATIAQALELWHRLDLPNVLIKVPATRGRRRRDRGADRPRRQRQRDAAVLRRALRGGDRGLSARPRAPGRRGRAGARGSPRWPRSSSRASTPRPTPCSPPTRRCAAGWRSPTRTHAYGRYLAPLRRRALGGAGARRREPAAPAVGEHRHQGPQLLRRALRGAADRARRDQHDAAERPCARSPTTATSSRPSAPTSARRWASSPPPPPKASTSTRSPPSWNARACRPSATPTPSCCAASKASAAR